MRSMRSIAVAQQWPIPHAELIVPTRHGDTFVIASGDAAAPALMLFHGSGANSSTWIREIAALSRDHRRVCGRHDWRTGLQRRGAAAARLGRIR